jgi:hypothetical protein
MAQAQTATTGKKRGTGPLKITYIDDAGKQDHKRIPENVTGVLVATKDGKSKSYMISDLPPVIRNQMVGAALAKRIDIYVRNTADEAVPASVVQAADGVFSTLKGGKFYTRGGDGSGKATGPKFDIDLWIEIMSAAQKAKNGKDATPKQITDLRTKLTAITGRERAQMLAKWTKDATVKLCKLEIEAKRAKAAAKGKKAGDYDALKDLF